MERAVEGGELFAWHFYLRRLRGETLGGIYAALLITWTSAKKEKCALLRYCLLYVAFFLKCFFYVNETKNAQ